MAAKIKWLLACSVAAVALPSIAAAAQARFVNIPAEDAAKSIPEFARQENIQIVAPVGQLLGVKTPAVSGSMDIETALNVLIDSTGLEVAKKTDSIIVLRRKTAANVDSAADGGSTSRSTPAASTESVVVTGTRIRTNGNDLPTPVVVVSAAQLQNTTPSNIPDGLNKLPIFAPATTSNSAQLGTNGISTKPTGNFLDIRGLGPIRTLVLMDGNRVPGTFFDTTVDTNMLPQMLVQRVEVVTGGASAVYGSDAIAGVVNFILDTKFDGFKGVIQGGISNYDDAKSFRAGLAGGEDIGDRGHLIWSLEYYERDAVPDSYTRPYGALNPTVVGSGTAASPYLLATDVKRSNLAFGGLVTSGPFNGQQFAPDGTLIPFNPGTPTPTANYVIGGDGAYQRNEYLLAAITTAQGFGRYDYNFNDNINGYVQASYALSRTYTDGNSMPWYTTSYPLTIYSGNAYLQPQYQAQLTATKTSSFQLNLYDELVSQRLSFDTQTDAFTVSTGLKGTAFNKFAWDFHYTHGDTNTNDTTSNNVNSMRLYAAMDAVKDPATGNTVCNVSLTAPGAYPGCVPFNPFGVGAASQAALNYISGPTSWVAHNTLDDFAGNITGPIFDNWAGPVQVAVGAEYRLQSLTVTTSVPDNTFNPQYLRVGPDGKSPLASDLMWIKNIQAPASGSENVYEGDIEVDAPLLKDLPLVQLLTVNGAYRYTQYSISGSANTWKAGLEWQVFEDLKVRAARSRDFRAPTLWDLYQKQSTAQGAYNDALTKTVASTTIVTGGNPNLKPEVARNTTAGVVYTPSWLPGLSASVDYFHIAIDNAINAVSGVTPSVQAGCNSSGGSSPLCALIVRPFPLTNTTAANFPTTVYSVASNVSRVWVEGFDFEVNYGTDLSTWTDLNGLLNFRGLWTHESNFKSQVIAGATIVNAAGTAQTPTDRATFTLDYNFDNFTVDVLERYYAAFHWTGDPTLVNQIQNVRAYFQTDLNFSYDFIAADQPLTGFLTVSNLFNTEGGLYAIINPPGSQYPVAPNTDVVGRYYTVGLRFKM